MNNNIEILEKILGEIEKIRISEKSFKKKEEIELWESKHVKFLYLGFNSMRHWIKRIKRLNELYAPYDHLKSDCLWNDVFECFYTLRKYIENHEELSSKKQIQIKLDKMNFLFLQLENDVTLKRMLTMARCPGSVFVTWASKMM